MTAPQYDWGVESKSSLDGFTSTSWGWPEKAARAFVASYSGASSWSPRPVRVMRRTVGPALPANEETK